MTLQINGETHTFHPAPPTAFAIELNLEIASRDRWSQIFLQDGDRPQKSVRINGCRI
jgi:sulfur carrier protein ThiS